MLIDTCHLVVSKSIKSRSNICIKSIPQLNMGEAQSEQAIDNLKKKNNLLIHKLVPNNQSIC